MKLIEANTSDIYKHRNKSNRSYRQIPLEKLRHNPWSYLSRARVREYPIEINHLNFAKMSQTILKEEVKAKADIPFQIYQNVKTLGLCVYHIYLQKS